MTVDIEKARDELLLIDTDLFVLQRDEHQSPRDSDYRAAAIRALRVRTRNALRALDVAWEEDVWTATAWSTTWAVMTTGGRPVVAGGLDRATALRIADDHNRIGKLERAARRVLTCNEIEAPTAYGDLRAALSTEAER